MRQLEGMWFAQVSVSGAIRWRASAQRSTARASSERLSEVRNNDVDDNGDEVQVARRGWSRWSR